MPIPSPPDTRESIIDLADKLIRQKGYNAFSYKDIADPLNIRNAAVHYHFPSKADLGKAVIARTRAKFQADRESWKGSSPTQQLEAFMQLYEHNRQESLVCFMGAMGPAYDTLPEPMQQELTAASEDIRSWVTKVLDRGRSEGQFQFSETAPERADVIIGCLLSALILQRVTQQDVLINVRTALMNNL